MGRKIIPVIGVVLFYVVLAVGCTSEPENVFSNVETKDVSASNSQESRVVGFLGNSRQRTYFIASIQ